jgi:hypothetical protein
MLGLLDEGPLQPFNREKCSTCCYREADVKGAFCYMFKHQPQCDCGAYRKYV